MKKVAGFIGLGVMGQSMAGHLARKFPEQGGELLVFDVDRSKVDSLVKGFAENTGGTAIRNVTVTPAGSIAEIGKKADIVFLSLPTSEIVRDVVLGDGGLAESLRARSIVADTSTTEMETTRMLARELEKKNIEFVDTPVSGGDKAAREGTLSFMAGGKKEVFDILKPFCNAMAASVVYLGGAGSGQATKAVNQMIVGVTFAIISEAFSMGVKSGLDPKTLYEAIKGGWAGSKLLDVAVQDMFSREFKPGGTVDIFNKDLGCALGLSRDNGTPTPITALVYELFKAAKARGEGKKSQTAIVRLWEDLLKIEIK